MFKKIHFVEIDSTHKYAMREMSKLEGGFFVITTDKQTSGIGRKGDAWIAKKKTGVLATFVFPIPSLSPAHNIAQLLALSTLHVLKGFSFSPLFKWPNDLLLSYKKVAGVMGAVQGQTAIVSIGLNVNSDEETLVSISQPTTSLFIERGELFDLDKVEERLIASFSTYLSRFFQSGFVPFLEDFSSHLAFKGKEAVIEGRKGIVQGIDPMGRLLLETREGLMTFSSGSLRLLDNSP